MTDRPDVTESMRLAAMALAEAGYPPDRFPMRLADPREQDLIPGVVVVIDSGVPDPVVWRACALATLHLDGPRGHIQCLARSGSAWGPCPQHPVADLLDGTDPGCPPTPVPDREDPT